MTNARHIGRCAPQVVVDAKRRHRNRTPAREQRGDIVKLRATIDKAMGEG